MARPLRVEAQFCDYFNIHYGQQRAGGVKRIIEEGKGKVRLQDPIYTSDGQLP